MFVVYAVPGALLPLYSLHLEQLGFTPFQTACCCATQAVASLFAALLAAQVADRWVSAERCLGICALLAGIDLQVLASLKDPAAIFTATLIFWLLTGPALMLVVAICFSHLTHPDRDYGPVRMWGTVGWVAMCWLLSCWPTDSPIALADSCRLAAILAFVLAAYSLTLPPTPPKPDRDGPAALAALRLLRGWPFATYCLCALGVNITLPFATQGTPLLLHGLGVEGRGMARLLTLAQVSEVITLALLPMLLCRLGMRGTLLLGVTAWMAALTVLSFGEPLWLVLGSLAFNGLCITGFVVAGQVFVNRHAHGGLRASAQALLTFVNGLGMLIGNLLVGWLRHQSGGTMPWTFHVGAVIMAGLVAAFLIGFREREEPAEDVPMKVGSWRRRVERLQVAERLQGE